MTLYFSYGANMDRAAMRGRCPGATPLGPARLEAYRFVITADGYASVTYVPGACTHGVVWRLTPRDLAALNIFESLDSGLYRRVLLPVLLRGNRMRALVYVGRRRRDGKPRPGYLDAVIEAARDWRLPENYVRELQRWSPASWRGKHPAETGDIG